MEKRFEPRFKHCIKDNKTHNTIHCDNRITVCKILNEQDEKIRELELLLNGQDKMKTMSIKGVEKLKQENQQLTKLYDQLNKKYCEEMDKNTILKQSQNSKAIEVLEKVRKFYNSDSESDWLIDCCKLDEYINNQITELRGEDGKEIR